MAWKGVPSMAPHDDDDIRLLTPAEAQEYLRLGRSKIYELLQTGELASIKLGGGKNGARRIPLTALRAFIERHLEAAK